MDIRSLHTIQSVENIPIELELAGLGNRVFAFLLDLLALGTTFIILLVAIGSLTHFSMELSKSLMNLLLVGSIMFAFAFHFFQEWLGHGKSIGKQLLHIRVVRSDGQVIGFWEAFGRNLIRFVDVYLMGIGLFPMMFTKSEKRFGDFLVGTLVINDQKFASPAGKATPASSTLDEMARPRLAPEEQELLRTYVSRKPKLFKAAREQLERQFRGYFQERWNLPEATTQEADFLQGLAGPSVKKS